MSQYGDSRQDWQDFMDDLGVLYKERLQLINVFKTTLTSDFSDLEERNYDYIIKLWNEVHNG